MAPTLLEAQGLSKRFASQTVLEDVNLAIHEKEVVTLVGHNGCGKTTLVRILLGLEKDFTGKIWRKDGLRMGYLPQKFHASPLVPVKVRAFLDLYADSPALVQEAAALWGVEPLMEKSLHVLSGGEMQRVLLARAMVNRPHLLVLDEPVQGVDMAGQSELYALIMEARNRFGCSVLMVSHDLHLVMAGTDRVLCLNRHICCSGHPLEVSKDPAFIRLFGPASSHHLALYEHHHDHHHGLEGEVIEDAHCCGTKGHDHG